MSPDRQFFDTERENIEQTVVMIEDLLDKRELSRFEVIALGTLLQNAYTGLERVLRWQLQDRDIRVPKTESWHKELLTQARQAGLLSERGTAAFTELLLFRHMHVHGYGHMLDEARLRELAAPVPELCRGFLREAEGSL